VNFHHDRGRYHPGGFFQTLPNRKNELTTLITNRFHFIGGEQPKILST